MGWKDEVDEYLVKTDETMYSALSRLIGLERMCRGKGLFKYMGHWRDKNERG